MNSITTYQHEQFGTIRTTTIDGEPWFVAKDVCDALDLKIVARAIDSLDEDEKGIHTVNTLGGNQQMSIISEAGLYSLVLRSRKPEAKAFKRWVTHEVLPSIRKTGSYSIPETDDDLLARALIVAQDRVKAIEGRAAELETENAEQREVIEVMRPKALFADAVAVSNTDIPVGDLAKILKRNGFDVGRNRLFETLRKDGFLMNQDSSRNMPTQKATDMKLLVLREDVLMTAKGTSYIRRMTMVTPYGQIYFVKRYCFVQRLNENGQLSLEFDL